MKKILWITLFFILSFKAFAISKATIQIVEKPPFVMGDVYHGELTFWPREEVTLEQIKGLEGHTLPGDKWYVGKVERARISENNELALVASLVLIPVAPTENNAGGVIRFGDNFFALSITPATVKEVKPVSEKFLALDQGIVLPKDIPWKTVGVSSIGGVLLIALVLLFLKRRGKVKKKGRDPIDWKALILKANSRSEMESLFSRREQWAGPVVEKDKAVIDFFELLYQHQYKKEWPPEVKDQMTKALAKVKERFSDELS